MKKTMLIIILFICAFFNYSIQASRLAGQLTTPIQEGVAETTVTLDMMNCKVGFYKTYADFANQKPRNWQYEGIDCSASNHVFKYYRIAFLDESGKKVKVPCNEFWGWKSQKGELCRNVPFNNGQVTAVSSIITWVTKGFVYYHASAELDNYMINPDSWFSKNLNDEMIEDNVYNKAHPEAGTMLKKIKAEEVKCLYMKREKHMTTEEATKRYYDCVAAIPDVIAFYPPRYFQKSVDYIK